MDAKLSLKNAVALKIEGKVTDWFAKEVNKEDFKSFKSLKHILAGKNEKLVDELVEKISSEISEAESTHITPQQIRKVIYSKAASVAHDVYLIDQETIKHMNLSK